MEESGKNITGGSGHYTKAEGMRGAWRPMQCGKGPEQETVWDVGVSMQRKTQPRSPYTIQSLASWPITTDNQRAKSRKVNKVDLVYKVAMEESLPLYYQT